jgi:flagellar hook assembly protein FlgD
VVRIDPDPTYWYLRGLTGDLQFTTNEWRDAGSRPDDTVAPAVTNVRARQEGVTLASANVPVFTPNGDGISDKVYIDYTLSEGAYLEVKVKRDGAALRRSTSWAMSGDGTVTWNGRKDNGDYAAEGNYNVYLTPTDRAGNTGEPAVVKVKLLNSVSDPRVTADPFWARDGDDRAAFAKFKATLTREADVSWIIRDQSGKVVRRGIDGETRQPGSVNFKWDGRNDAGAFVPDGKYFARIRVVRQVGTYAHEVVVRQTPFLAQSPRWRYKRGETMKLTLYSTEYLQGKPVVTVNQPGIPKYVVPAAKVKRHSDRKFTVTIKTKDQGRKGTMTLRVVGTDKGGGKNKKFYSVKLR